jgi:hypothetical protein
MPVLYRKGGTCTELLRGGLYACILLYLHGVVLRKEFLACVWAKFRFNVCLYACISLYNLHSVVLRKDILACVWAKFWSRKIERKNIWDEDLDAILKEIGTGEKVLIMMRKHHFW